MWACDIIMVIEIQQEVQGVGFSLELKGKTSSERAALPVFLLSTRNVDWTSGGNTATLRPQGHKHKEEDYLLKTAEEKGGRSQCP